MDGNRYTAQICCLASVLFLSNEVLHNASKEVKVDSGLRKKKKQTTVCGISELKCLHCSINLRGVMYLLL